MNQQVAYIVSAAILYSLVVLSSGAEDPQECEDFVKKEMYSCCKTPEDVETKLEGRAEIFKACQETIIGSKDKGIIEDENLECMEECLFNGTKWLTKDMKLNKEVITDELSTVLGINQQWKNAINKSLNLCFENDVTKEIKEDTKCKSGSFQLVKCLFKQIYLYCPDDSWQKEKEECSKAKEIMVKCSLSFGK